LNSQNGKSPSSHMKKSHSKSITEKERFLAVNSRKHEPPRSPRIENLIKNKSSTNFNKANS